jgi:hypothetical protein
MLFRKPIISGWTTLLLIIVAAVLYVGTPYRYALVVILGVALALYFRSLLLVQYGESPRMLTSYRTERTVILSYLWGFLFLFSFYTLLVWIFVEAIYRFTETTRSGSLDIAALLTQLTGWTPVTQTLVLIFVLGVFVAFSIQFWSVSIMTERCSPLEAFARSSTLVYASFWTVLVVTVIRVVLPVVALGGYALFGVLLTHVSGVSEQAVFVYVVGLAVLIPLIVGFYYYTKVELYGSLVA